MEDESENLVDGRLDPDLVGGCGFCGFGSENTPFSKRGSIEYGKERADTQRHNHRHPGRGCAGAKENHLGLSDEPEEKSYHDLLASGEFWLKRNEWDKAIVVFELAIKQYPDEPGTRMWIGPGKTEKVFPSFPER